MSIENFQESMELIQKLTAEMQKLVMENPDECAHCLASDHVDANATSLTNQLFNVGKAEPEALLQSLMFVGAQHAAIDVMLQKLWTDCTNLWPECFEEEADELAAAE